MQCQHLIGHTQVSSTALLERMVCNEDSRAVSLSAAHVVKKNFEGRATAHGLVDAETKFL
jgi:hypothetical protein